MVGSDVFPIEIYSPCFCGTFVQFQPQECLEAPGIPSVDTNLVGVKRGKTTATLKPGEVG